MDLKKQMALTLPLSYQMKCQDMATGDTHRLSPCPKLGSFNYLHSLGLRRSVTPPVMGWKTAGPPCWSQAFAHTTRKPHSPSRPEDGKGWERRAWMFKRLFFSYYRNCEPIGTTNCHFPTSFRTLMDKFVLNFYKNEKQTKIIFKLGSLSKQENYFPPRLRT